MGLRTQVNLMCKGCIYDKHDAGTWRDQVEKCGIETCPLWNVRPLTTATVNKQRADKKAQAES